MSQPASSAPKSRSSRSSSGSHECPRTAPGPIIQHPSWPSLTDLGNKQGHHHPPPIPPISHTPWPVVTDPSSRQGLHPSPTTHPPAIVAHLRPPIWQPCRLPPTSPLESQEYTNGCSRAHHPAFIMAHCHRSRHQTRPKSSIIHRSVEPTRPPSIAHQPSRPIFGHRRQAHCRAAAGAPPQAHAALQLSPAPPSKPPQPTPHQGSRKRSKKGGKFGPLRGAEVLLSQSIFFLRGPGSPPA